MQRQGPALVAAARMTEEPAALALDALQAARAHYDRRPVGARDARYFADRAANRLRRHEAAIYEVQRELAGLPEGTACH